MNYENAKNRVLLNKITFNHKRDEYNTKRIIKKNYKLFKL